MCWRYDRQRSIVTLRACVTACRAGLQRHNRSNNVGDWRSPFDVPQHIYRGNDHASCGAAALASAWLKSNALLGWRRR